MKISHARFVVVYESSCQADHTNWHGYILSHDTRIYCVVTSKIGQELSILFHAVEWQVEICKGIITSMPYTYLLIEYILHNIVDYIFHFMALLLVQWAKKKNALYTFSVGELFCYNFSWSQTYAFSISPFQQKASKSKIMTLDFINIRITKAIEDVHGGGLGTHKVW